MKMKESIILNTTVEKLWDLLKDPGNMPLWNPKCIDVKVDKNIYIGSRFEVTFQMREGAEAGKMDCEVIEFKEYKKLVIRYSGEMVKGKIGHMDEIFIIAPAKNGQLELKRHLDLSKTKLPFFLRIIMWFISTFGYSVGKTCMEEIRDLLS